MKLSLVLEVDDNEPEPDLAAAKLLRFAAAALERDHLGDPSFGTVRYPAWAPINCVWSWRGDQNLDLLGKR